MTDTGPLLGAREIRRLAAQVDLRPTKTLGQNFVHDANTVRRIVSLAEVTEYDDVLEVGPGLGSLTLALLGAAGTVTAVEVDARLAEQLPVTVAGRYSGLVTRLDVITADALTVRAADLPRPPTALVANLPYNVAVPVVLHLLAECPSLQRALVMVQAEVADRLAAGPGSRVYGSPSVKLAWYGSARRVGTVPRSVFWPVPQVDSALVEIRRRPVAETLHQSAVSRAAVSGAAGSGAAVSPAAVSRTAVFAVVDAAFAQRRKTLRAALATWAGSGQRAEAICRAAGVDPAARGETLDVAAYVALAEAAAGRDADADSELDAGAESDAETGAGVAAGEEPR